MKEPQKAKMLKEHGGMKSQCLVIVATMFLSPVNPASAINLESSISGVYFLHEMPISGL